MIIIFVLCLIIIWFNRQFKLFEHFEPDQKYFPLQNPFKQSFYHPLKINYKILGGQLHQNILHNIIGDDNTYGITDTTGECGSTYNILSMINQRTCDFAIIPQIELSNYTLPNVRFVSSLYSTVVTILSTNDSNIYDISDIVYRSRCKVTIGVLKGPAHTCLRQILNTYSNITQKIHIVTVLPENIHKEYGQKFILYFGLVTHPDHTINMLTKKIPSHLVSIKNINNGAYHITDNESQFFKTYPFYQKKLIDLIQAKHDYIMLSSYGNKQLYIPSIKSPYVLLCHDKISNIKVKDIIRNILLLRTKSALFKGVTVEDMYYIPQTLSYHEGADEVFKQFQTKPKLGLGG
jgi:TRAP-type uncharacterized transport system substrate-binding protein